MSGELRDIAEALTRPRNTHLVFLMRSKADHYAALAVEASVPAEAAMARKAAADILAFSDMVARA